MERLSHLVSLFGDSKKNRDTSDEIHESNGRHQLDIQRQSTKSFIKNGT